MGQTQVQSREQHGTDLVSAYIEHIGNKEPHNPRFNNLSTSSPRHASLLIGRSCLHLSAGSDSKANRVLRRARDSMHAVADQPVTQFNHASSYGAHLFHLATMLLERDQTNAAETFQLATHRQAVDDLLLVAGELKDCSRRRREDLVGQRAEQLMIALLTRHEDNGALTVKALAHHDITGVHRRGSYDLLVIGSTGGAGTGPTPHEGQVKDKCQNFCCGREGVPRGLAMRGDYERDIVIVSGHCDIHAGQAGAMTEWLAEEVTQAATSEVIDTLNGRTHSLLQTVVRPEEWRVGTLPVGGQ